MYFKDLITELTEGMKKIIDKKNFRRCPKCRKGTLKQTNHIQHCCEVAASKFASLLIGGAVPAPDYRYTCPKCGAVCIFVDGKYVPLPMKTKGKDDN